MCVPYVCSSLGDKMKLWKHGCKIPHLKTGSLKENGSPRLTCLLLECVAPS